jgi:integrase
MNVVFSYGKGNNVKSERQNINIRVHHSSLDFRRSTFLEISSRDWDVNKKELKLSGAKSPDERRYLLSVQEKLDDIKRAFEREFLELRLSHQLTSITTKKWKEWCEVILKKGLNIFEEINIEAPYLTDKMKDYLEFHRKDFADNTVKGYESNLKLLKAFEVKSKKKYRTDEIDLDWYKSLRDWNTEGGNNDNYFGSIIQKVKAVINYYRSIDKNFPYHPNIDHKKFKTIKLSHDHDVVTEVEMELIYKYSGIGYLENVRDLIIIQYHACLRYEELESQLNKGKEALEIYKVTNDKNEEKYFWKILENKTGRLSRIKKVVPVHKKILNLYHSANFPHIITSQVYNRYTKELMKLLEIDKKVSSHTFRRSFITNMYNNGIDEDYIMQYSGHIDRRTLRKSYIKTKNVFRENPIPTE